MELSHALHSVSKSERGQGLVEFALSITMLLFFLAGIIDLGRAFFTYMAMRDAAQEGASYAAINPIDRDAIIQRVTTTSTFPVDLSSPDISVNPEVTEGPPCAGGAVRVTVTYENFPLIFPFSNVIFGKNTISLSTSVTDTILLPVCD